ncbi:hypothetical protein [Paenibacillus piri]|uniref:Uncharacterized protein n=1 Tax=Paenibacillus piri TaxID=2547395 RepID=A0A4R5KLL0_9BACL|nr:hypothetical protein [Paenibacillus piri]TDF95457.1 hypothetical protein E1757_20325 [Paenibacillus piri]
MIPKVSKVDSIILADNMGQAAYKFKKIIFHKDRQYLLLHQEDNFQLLRTRYDDGFLKLIEVSNKEYQELKDLGWLDFDQPNHNFNSNREFSVTGICFNRLGNESSMIIEYKSSSIEKPLDILPYIVQTGAEHVFFSE